MKRIIASVFGMLIGSGVASSATAEQPSVKVLASPWQEIRPGGRTSCAFGDPYAFFVKPGDDGRLLVHYQGGGACWNGDNCVEGKATFRSNINDLLGKGPEPEGIFDFDHPDNPYADWTHVFVPYCTGDVHWGDNDQIYQRNDGQEVVIRHRGAVNAGSALAWMREHLHAPSQVAVTGCSAGSYGSIYWTPHVRELFADADFSQLGDAGAGVLTEEFQVTNFPHWHPEAHAADWIAAIDPARTDWTQFPLTHLYESIGGHYPKIRLAQYNANKDLVQRLFYKIMGGSIFTWRSKMEASMRLLSSGMPQFRYYIAGRRSHCVTDSPDFYSVSRGGFAFRDWMSAYIHGDPVTDVD